MTVKQFLKLFSHGSVVFRLESSDGYFPVICRSDVYAGEYEDISALYTFNLLDCEIIDIFSTSYEIHVLILK